MTRSTIHGSKSKAKHGANSSFPVRKPTTLAMASIDDGKTLISSLSRRGKKMADMAYSCPLDLDHLIPVEVQPQENQTRTSVLGTTVRAHMTRVKTPFESDASAPCLASVEKHVNANVICV